jgi:outer membrane protein assembly factor BamE (lipoprotein component of BamABCDE complex)
MKKIIITLSVLLFISNCTLNKVENRHGVPFLEAKNIKLIENKTNKNDILELLGPPSTKSLFNNDVWIYIEKKTTKKSIFKLGKQKKLKDNALVLEINNKGMLVSKKLYTIESNQEIKFAKQTTETKDKDSFVYGFLSSLRQKIDSPKRLKKVKKQ